ncbi:MAG: hypothetical protein N3A54_00475 [Patescibacteria group bacterium]|nr:hypothetical protein [Patescibacteria group bacterium]
MNKLKKRKIKKQDIINYAKKFYTQNPLEFNSDYLLIKYLKAQLNRFINNKKINIRLMLNYIIMLNNVFESPKILCRILFLECDEETWPVLATLLYFLNLAPEKIICDNHEILIKNIIDEGLLRRLNEL